MAPSKSPYNDRYVESITLSATTSISGFSCGVMTSIYLVCMYNLVHELRSKRATRQTAVLTAWITALWIFASISTISDAACSIYAFSWQMNYPGGPGAYLADSWNAPIPMLASSAYIVTTWLADAMMLWRLFIFCHGINALSRFLVLAFMSLIYVGIVGLGCFLMVIMHLNQTLYSDFSMKVAIPYFTLSVTLNVFGTAFICIRLFFFKKQMEQSLGHKEIHKSPYTSVAAMLIESSALYAVWSLGFIIVYTVGNPVQTVMLMTLGNIQVIAPVLIVYRVSKGKGWEHTTSTKLEFKAAEAKPPPLCDPGVEHPNTPIASIVFASKSPSVVESSVASD